MRAILAGAFIIAGFAAGLSPASAAPQLKAEVTCLASPEPLAYECLVRLTRADNSLPVDGADVTVVADMPAAPLGPKAQIVAANAVGQPGIYRFRLALQRRGEWALRIGTTRPVREIMEARLDFAERAVTPKP